MNYTERKISELKMNRLKYREMMETMQDRLQNNLNKKKEYELDKQKLDKAIKKYRFEIFKMEKNGCGKQTKFIFNKQLTSKKNKLSESQEKLEKNGYRMNQAEKMINMCNDKIVYFTEKLDNIWEELDKETKNLDKFKSSDCWDDPPPTSINVKNLSKVEKKQENKYYKKEVTRRNWWESTESNKPIRVYKYDWRKAN